MNHFSHPGFRCLALFAFASIVLTLGVTPAGRSLAADPPADAPPLDLAPPTAEPRELDDVEADEKKKPKEEEDKPLDPNKKRDDAQFELQEWSVWLADPTAQQVNGTDRYPSTMPGIVDTSRSRKQPKAKKSPSPLGMITFHGKSAADIDLDLGVQSGRFVAHWPPAETKSSRLRWLSAALDARPDEKAQLAFVAPDHWLSKVRSLDSLYLRRGARTERAIVYDAELSYALPIKLSGGPDKYEVSNQGNTTLYDVVIVVNTPQGRRVGWIDELPPSKPAAKPAQPNAGAANVPGAQPGRTVRTEQVKKQVNLPDGTVQEVVETRQVVVSAAGDEKAKAEAAEAAARDAAAKAEAVKQEAVKAEAAKANAAKVEAVRAASEKAAAEVKAEAEAVATKAGDAKAADAKAATSAPAVTVKPEAGPPGNAQPAASKAGTPQAGPPAADPPAPPVGVSVSMSAPIKSDSDEFKKLTAASLTSRLVKAGLKRPQAELLVSIYAEGIFASDALTVAWRMPGGFMDEKFPITVYPEPLKTTRVALFIATNLDPKINDDLQGLIAKMGDAKYKEREAAMHRLLELGPLAYPALKQALGNPDAEIAMRAERVLLEQKQSIDVPNAANAIKQAGGLIQRVLGN